jgi:ligand-binding sensor domain-containing protein
MWDGKKFSNYGIADGFVSGTVYSVICDKQGQIWVGTNKGVDRVSFNTDGSIKQIKNYGINEGFKGLECNSRSVTMDRFGNLYFGTIKGVIKYSPEQESSQISSNTKVQIESFKVNFNDYSDFDMDAGDVLIFKHSVFCIPIGIIYPRFQLKNIT